MDRCLVTGGTGFIGSNLVKALCEEGINVRCLVRKDSPRDNLEGLDVEFIEGDILDEASLSDAVKGCDFVFHAAALYAFWIPEPQDFYRVNVNGTLNVLRASKRAGISRVVYTSTAATVGATEGETPLNEEGGPGRIDLWELGDHYTRSKILAESEVMRMAREGLDVVIVNPPAPIGWGDIKPTPTGLLILKFLNGEVPFYTDVMLCPVNVKDVARGHILALKKGRRGEKHILGGRNMRLSEIFSKLSEITGLPRPKIKFPRGLASSSGYIIGALSEAFTKVTKKTPLITRTQAKAARFNIIYSSEKAERELGYKISAVEDAMKDAVEYFLERGYVKKKRAKKLWMRG